MPDVPTMKRLGWGNPDDSDYYRKHITTIRRHKVALTVRKEAAPLFVALLDGLVQVEGVRWLTRKSDDWGYANRNIRGSSSSKSYHAWGLAVDVNAADNPSQDAVGKMRENMPPNATTLAENMGMEWGGDWTSLKDPMHFEVHGSRDSCLKRVKDLTPTLKPGAEGYPVRVLQRALNAHLGRSAVEVTARFDTPTARAVATFKTRHQLHNTPHVGALCWTALGLGPY